MARLAATALQILLVGCDTSRQGAAQGALPLRSLQDLRSAASNYSAGPRSDEEQKQTIGVLRGMLRNHSEPLRLEAIAALRALSMPTNDGRQTSSIGEVFPELAAIATDPQEDEQLRGQAIDAMKWLRADFEPPLHAVLTDAAAPLQLRLLSARSLKWSEAGRIDLRKAVDDLRLPAAVRLAALEAVCEGARADCAAATETSPDLRASAAGSVALTNRDPKPLAELATALRDPSRRREALVAIKLLGARGALVLADALDDSDPELRRVAATSLGSLRESAKGAIPALLRARQDPSELVRSAVQAALDDIGPPLWEISVILSTAKPGDQVFEQASYAAMRMDEYAAELIPAVRRFLRSPDSRLRAAALGVLLAFHVPREAALWNDASPDSPLGLFRRAARDVLPDVIADLRQPDKYTRFFAAKALGVLLRSQAAGPARFPAVQALSRALDDPRPDVKMGAVDVLGSLVSESPAEGAEKEEAALVTAALNRASKDENPAVRGRAAEWLKRSGEQAGRAPR